MLFIGGEHGSIATLEASRSKGPRGFIAIRGAILAIFLAFFREDLSAGYRKYFLILISNLNHLFLEFEELSFCKMKLSTILDSQVLSVF
jgi:hypothetical protein